MSVNQRSIKGHNGTSIQSLGFKLIAKTFVSQSMPNLVITRPLGIPFVWSLFEIIKALTITAFLAIIVTSVRKTLHWLFIKQHVVFKTALVVYKLLHSYPNILYVSLNLDVVSITCSSQTDGVFPEVPHFTPSVYKSTNHFFPSALLMMLQRFGMICLMMYVRQLLSTHSERS